MAVFDSVRIAAVQATPVILDAEATIEKAIGLIGEAADLGATLDPADIPAYGLQGWDDVARWVGDDHVAGGIEAEFPAAFVDEAVVEPAELDEVVELVAPTPGPVMDVMRVDERPLIAPWEPASLIACPEHRRTRRGMLCVLFVAVRSVPSFRRIRSTVDALQPRRRTVSGANLGPPSSSQTPSGSSSVSTSSSTFTIW